MNLGALADAIGARGALSAPEQARGISAVVQDSRAAGPGSLFVALRGNRVDGHRFLPQVIRQGAAAVVVEEDFPAADRGDVAVIKVADTRKALAALAVKFYGDPSRRLKLVGITGTKGKTTTSYLVKSVIEAAGRRSGLIGTIEYRVGDRVVAAPNTTPESLDIQALLNGMIEQGAGYCVMEVSSHALALGRTDGCVFEAAAFTNLAPEHLDFHATLDDYFDAKLLLFSGLGPDKTAVVNVDDPRGREVVRRASGRVISYGTPVDADVRPAGPVATSIRGMRFTATTPAGDIEIESGLVGRFNVSNILAAIGLGLALGFPREAVAQGIRAMRAVPGRMEPVNEGQPFGVVVDYAHTEDSLVALLTAIRDMAPQRVITVFGCGGDRDRTKRPRMGAAALAGSDLVIVTSDNPRTEAPGAIIDEIEAGMRDSGERFTYPNPPVGRTKPYAVIPDRAAAIDAAIGLAQPGDIVVLAGKGHETYQIVGETKQHFDDREEARKAIGKRQGR